MGVFFYMVYLFKNTNNYIEFGLKSLEFMFISFAVMAALFLVLLLISLLLPTIKNFRE